MARMNRLTAPVRQLWHWWGRDPSPRRHGIATFLMLAVFCGATWAGAQVDNRTRANTARLAKVVEAQEADRVARRVTTAANNYALCQFGVNDTRMQVADMVGLAFNLSSQSRSESQQALVDAAVARVTAGLTLFDCSVYLAGLTPTQVAEVQSTTIPPTLPRRP